MIETVGPGLSAVTLVALLQRVGCVRAIELDMNPEWRPFVRDQATAYPANPTPINLLPTTRQAADRYDVTSARDFLALHAR